MDSNSVLLVGLPESGKTTFLAALICYVKSQVVDKKLSQYRDSEDEEYLNNIYHKWLECEQQSRTIHETATNRIVKMYLENIDLGQQTVLNIPDIEGEAFKDQWISRSISKDYVDSLRTSKGILFFINPIDFKPHNLISGIDSRLDDFLTGLTDEENENDTDETEENDEDEAIDDPSFEKSIEKWVHDEVPVQVRIVELIQIHLDQAQLRGKLLISFIISAWDTQIESEVSPADWIKLNMPLLYQYLVTNPELIEYDILGVSAQGGNYDSPGDVEELLSVDAVERIKVNNGKETSFHGIAHPLNWILKTWQKTSV